MSTTFYVIVSTSTYLMDPLTTLTFALFWPQIRGDRGIGLLSMSFSWIFPDVAQIGLHLGCLPWGGPGETRGGAFLVGRVFPWRP
jgi:hypothetical protein